MALLALLGSLGVAGCTAGAGPDTSNDELVVESLPLDAPVLLDPAPAGWLPTSLSATRSAGGYQPAKGTLYGDPDRTDPLRGPVLLLGSSDGSAYSTGPPPDAPRGREVDLGGRTGRLVPDGDRTWVLITGNDHLDFVVARGVDDDELIAAARGTDFDPAGPTLAAEAVPDGLTALVTGSPADRPGVSGAGETLSFQRERSGPGVPSSMFVSAVKADPRLAALWGFWTGDTTGTEVRGQPGYAGSLQGSNAGAESQARVWTERGLVLAVVVSGDDGNQDEVLDAAVENLRVGTWAEVEALQQQIASRPPTRTEVSWYLPNSGFVSGVDGTYRWSFQLARNPTPGTDELVTSYDELTTASGGGGTIAPSPPVGEVAVSVGEVNDLQIVGGLAPPGSARVTITTADGRLLTAVISSDDGPRPGERVWAVAYPGARPGTSISTPPYVVWSITATAYDAAGVVLASTTV